MMVLEAPELRLEMVRTHGEVLEMLATYAPGSPPPPAHFHPSQREEFFVERGALRFEIAGRERIVRAGESVVIEPRTVHSVRNHSSTESAHVRWETRPALRSAQMFEAVSNMNRRGFDLLTAAAIAREFEGELVLASPPRMVQTCLFGLLAPIARAIGRGPEYRR